MKIDRIVFELAAWEDHQYWLSHDKELLKRLNNIIRDTCREPFSGIGKPERLKEDLKGYWSRRITTEHRLVYTVQNDALVIVQCRYHY